MSKKKIHENLGMQYLEELSGDPKYSLAADPTGFYELDENHKTFIELYSQYNNLAIVCELMEIEPFIGKDYLLRFSTQQELRRLNLARYHRQIATKIISYQDLGSYLSSWLIGDATTESDKLKKSEKLQLIKLMMDWHKGMAEYSKSPHQIIDITVEEELEELKATDIRELLQKKKLLKSISEAQKEVQGEEAIKPEKPKKSEKAEEPQSKYTKKQLIEIILEAGKFSESEREFIETLTVKELEELIK